MISCSTCHHLSGATWPASRHRSHHRTTGQQWSTATVNGGQRRSSAADHCRGPPPVNGGGPPSDHRWSTGQRWLTVSQQPGLVGSWAGLDLVLGWVWIGSGSATWHATWYHVSADVAAAVA
ncbi:hypothetical protein Tco_0358751 [Tanacetum coccineum]